MAIPVSAMAAGMVNDSSAEIFGNSFGSVGMEEQRVWTSVVTQSQSLMVDGLSAEMPVSQPGMWTANIQNSSSFLDPHSLMPYAGWDSTMNNDMAAGMLAWCAPASLHDQGSSMGSWSSARTVGADVQGEQCWDWADFCAGAEQPSRDLMTVLSISVDGMQIPFQLLQDDLFRVFSRYGTVHGIEVKPDGDAAEIAYQDFTAAWSAVVDLDKKLLPELGATLCVQLADRYLPTKEDLLRCLAAVEANAQRALAKDILMRKAGAVDSSSNLSGVSCCVVCQDAPRCVVFEPCKHLACCTACGGDAGSDMPRLTQCPVCRAKILRRLEVFVS